MDLNETRKDYEKLHSYASSNIISMITLRRMTWAGHVAHTRKMRNSYKTSVGKPEGQTNLETHVYIW